MNYSNLGLNTEQPLVSAIVPVFNDRDRLKMCLQSLTQQTYPSEKLEIIVVDNGSEEDIKSLVEGFNGVTYCYEGEPGSYAARNKAISVAKGEIFAFTDADCLPANQWVEAGVRQFLQTPNCGLAAGNIELFFKNCDRPTAVEVYESIEMGFDQDELIAEQQYGLTANLFTSRQIIAKVGCFDPNLKSGGDREWGQRVFAAGYELIFVPNALVKHPTRHSFWQLYKRITRINGGNFDVSKIHVSFQQKLKSIGKDLFLAFTPPFRSIFRLWSEEKLPTNTRRIQFVSVMLFVRYVSAWERIRLKLGGASRRW